MQRVITQEAHVALHKASKRFFNELSVQGKATAKLDIVTTLMETESWTQNRTARGHKRLPSEAQEIAELVLSGYDVSVA